MRECPVCSKKIEIRVCASCGFDDSKHYETYPTFGMLPIGTKSVAGLRAERKPISGHCRCCGRFFSGDSCLFCGFPAIADDSAENQIHIQHLADNHRNRILEELTDFSVECYHCHQKGHGWTVSTESIRIGDGQECVFDIRWMSMEFGQVSLEKYPLLPVVLTYRYQGVKKRVICQVPTVGQNSFWKLGIQIDQALCVRVFLGDYSNYTVSEPVALQLK